MCGIVGILGKPEDRKSTMQRMLLKQQHRGPDATEIWESENVILGHNRLSIIDLSAAANQPMRSDCGNYVIVFNGEIYNYKELKSELKSQYHFTTESDTEVILAAYKKWGKSCLSHFNGMFAMAIWDVNKKQLFLARDRFGVKPLYYSLWEGSLYFASEIKTLWVAGIPKQMNLPVWANYFSNASYGQPSECFWKFIQPLPAGQCTTIPNHNQTTFSNTSLQMDSWYDFVSSIKNQQKLSEIEFRLCYENLLNDTIQLRFRSDVPVGFNISGGLDSSLLLAQVNSIFPDNKKIEAFTFYSDDAQYDELPWVNQMIAQTGNPLNKCLFKVNEVPDLIQNVGYYQDEPFGGFPTLAYSLLFKEARERGIIVLLDGQGMDEAWAGYDYYTNNAGHTIQGTLSSPTRKEIFNDDFLALANVVEYPEPFESQIQNLQYRDLFYTKLPRALRFNDRISMMHSTELREPFLDYRLVELAFAQPDAIKVKDGQTKQLLRKIVSEMLGDNIALAPKRALQTPQREWIAGDLMEYVNDAINEFKKIDFVNGMKTDALWSDYLKGNNENSFYIWQWINTASLFQQKI